MAGKLLGFLVLICFFVLAGNEAVEGRGMQKIIELRSWELKDDSTLAMNNADGTARTTFHIDCGGSVVFATFGWGVKPGAVPAFLRGVSITGPTVTPLQGELTYDLKTLKGAVTVGGKECVIDAPRSSIENLEIWDRKAKSWNIARVQSLLQGIPITILKPE
jgi:hypothetical protein